MIISLKGHIIDSHPLGVHLSVHDIGYEIHTPINVYEYIKSQNLSELFLHTRVIYKEDSQVLYGFFFLEERLLFDFLYKLRGIGATIAMNIISTLGSKTTLETLLHQKIAFLVKVPKIGKAKAGQIFFEAKKKHKQLNKMLTQLQRQDARYKQYEPHLDGVSEVPLYDNSSGYSHEQAIQEESFVSIIHNALISLGFQKKEILEAERKLYKQELDLPKQEEEYIPEWIRLYLSLL